MKTTPPTVALMLALALTGSAAAQTPAQNPPYTMFKDQRTGKQLMLPMIQRSVLQGVPGKINQMAVNTAVNRLYVAAKGKGSLEMLDIGTNKQQPAIVELPEPNGVLIAPELKKLVVSCGGDNSVRVFGIEPNGDLRFEKKMEFPGETESLRYDPVNKRVYVSHGRNLGSFNLETGQRAKSLGLPAMSRGFVIDPGSDRIYVNMPSNGSIAVVKRTPEGASTLETTWEIKGFSGNNPMALDPAAGHLFTVTRSPTSRFVVVDTKTGALVGEPLPCVDQVESLWWDPVQRRVYASGGGSGGRVDIFQQAAGAEGKAPSYSLLHSETTAAGACTSIFVPEQRRLIVAAPQFAGSADPTFLYVYLVGP
ncbi:MAG: YncE family protein [Phycisphaerales bacterium]